MKPLLALLVAAQATIIGATIEVPANYATVQAALNAAQPGDTVRLAAGTYAENVITVRDGTVSGPITVDGQGVATIKRFTLAHSRYTLKNLTFKGTTNAYWGQLYLGLGANFNLVRDCVVDSEHSLKVYGIHWETRAGDPNREASDNIIERTLVRNVSSYPMVGMAGVRNTLRQCVVRDGLDVDFLRLTGISNHIEGNQFLYNRAAPDGTGNHPDFVQTFGNNGEQSYGHVIERNLVNGVDEGQLFQFSATGQPNIRDWMFRNNVFANAALGGGGNVPGMKFYNNVFYNIGSGISFSYRVFGYRTGIDDNYPIYSEMTQPTPSGRLVAEGDGGIYRYGGYYQVRTAQIELTDALVPGRRYEARTRGTGLIWYNGVSYVNEQVFTAVAGVTTWSETAENPADLEPTQLYTYAELTYNGRTYGRNDWFQVDPAVRTWTSNYPDAVAPWRVVIDFAHRGEMKNNVFLDCGQPGMWQAFYAFDLALREVSADYNYVGKDGFQPIRVRAGEIPVGDPRGWGGKGWYEPHGINGGDPRFSSLADLNFLPLAGSFLIDRGVSLAEVREDFRGTLRPVGGGYDIGAFEVTGVLAGPPTSPRGLRVALPQ